MSAERPRTSSRLEASSVATCILLLSCGRRTAPSEPLTSEPSITFVRDGHVVRALGLSDMQRGVREVSFRAYDPYYGHEKRWRALPLAPVLSLAFGESAPTLESLDFVLRARDGYAVPMTGTRLLEAGAHIAFADVEVPSWEPIGPQRANPSPFYLVWREPNQQSLETHPRPWQLARIDIAPFHETYPHTFPNGAGTEAQAGFSVFRHQCIACHAMNREGGRVGPELNVPMSIVEYRPEAQIRAYIRNPATFRYGNMPAHPHLSDADLDALVAYFRAMSTRKFDPKPTTSDAGFP